MRFKVGDRVIVNDRANRIERLCSCKLCKKGSDVDQYYYLHVGAGKRGHELELAYKIGEQLLFNFTEVV